MHFRKYACAWDLKSNKKHAPVGVLLYSVYIVLTARLFHSYYAHGIVNGRYIYTILKFLKDSGKSPETGIFSESFSNCFIISCQ